MLRTRMKLLSALVVALPVTASTQEGRERTTDPERSLTVMRLGDRPMLGIVAAIESDGADSLGLLVEDLRTDSPAAKAGINIGDRLQSISGVSLRANHADAGHDYHRGSLLGRLRRELAKVNAGDTLTVGVLSDGRAHVVQLVLESYRARVGRIIGSAMVVAHADRVTLGLWTSARPSPRDTLGVLVSSVASGGPADRAGIVEGDRIAAINGVSLRAAREDAGNPLISAAKAQRLRRELNRLTAGDAVDLQIVSAGRTRAVRVTTAKASELPDAGRIAEFLPSGLLENAIPPIPPAPTTAVPREHHRLRFRRL